MDPFASAVGSFVAEVELTSKRMDEGDSIGWVVVCIDMEEPITISYATGVFNSPEEAFVEAGKQARDSERLHDSSDPGWKYSVVPLFAPTS